LIRAAPRSIALHGLFAQGRPAGQPVCHDGQRLILWGEFASRVAALATQLAARAEARWLLVSDEPLCFVIRLLALLYAGKQVVIPPNGQTGTLAALADRFDARCTGGESIGAQGRLPAIAAEAAVIELWTSGSTGAAKRVRKTLAQFEAEVAVLESLWGEAIGAAAMLATVPHQHIYGLLFRLFWPLSSGRVFDTVTCAHPDTLEQRMAVFGAAALVSSPAQIARLPELLPPGSLSSLHAVFSSGGPLSAAAASAFTQRFALVPIEVFGSTETGGIAWRQQRGDDGADLWTPFPGLAVARADSGALALRSPFLGTESSVLLDDAIDLRPDGRFRLLGRLDRIVKIEEKRLSLPEMEARLDAHAWLDAAAVVPLAGRRQSLGAVLVLNGEGRQQLATTGRRALAQALRRHLAGYFEAVLLPRHWRFVDRLPINERGKISHAALAALFSTGARPVLLPAVFGVRRESGDRIVVDLQASASLEYFAGHFAGRPILPGVVQVDWAVRQARQHFAIDGNFSRLENLKFQSLVLPDTRLELALTWDAQSRRLDFSYASGERKCSGGRILFDSPA
jgi:acyl-CoA synthetase (AMP-forming)/AMP-acid ligase II/3-hydroxymyristoyl/3-hydroxydecanoyl-(acyl carrier protein) dehydratase